MKRMSAAELLALHKRTESDLTEYRNLWDEIAGYCLPSRAGVTDQQDLRRERTTKIWDSTAPEALDDLAHYLASVLTPSASEWMKLRFRQDELMQVDEYVEWLEACTAILQSEFTRSNFYSAFGEVYQDLPAFGIGIPQITEKRGSDGEWKGLHFEAIFIGEITGIADEYGEFSTTFRSYEKPAIYWAGLFGDDLKGMVAEMARDTPEKMVQFLHAVYPRDEKGIDRKGIANGTALPNRLPFASVWVNCHDKMIVRESGYHELPRYVTKWGGASNTDWGYSPAMRALPDIRTLNEAKRLEIAAWERSIDRPMVGRENNLVGDLEIGARGLTIVRDVNQLKPLFDASDFNLTAIKIQDLRESILRAFYADLIREPAGGEAGPEKTAYEVARRLERAQRILGEAVGHLRVMLRWTVERSFQVMYRAGQLPQPPEGLLEMGAQIDVKYTSPLQAAQEGVGLESVLMFIGDLQMIAQFNEQVIDRVDWDGLTSEIARRRNVPARALLSDEQMMELRQARAEQMQQAQAMQAAQAESEVVRNVGQGAGKEAAMRLVNGG